MSEMMPLMMLRTGIVSKYHRFICKLSIEWLSERFQGDWEIESNARWASIIYNMYRNAWIMMLGVLGNYSKINWIILVTNTTRLGDITVFTFYSLKIKWSKIRFDLPCSSVYGKSIWLSGYLLRRFFIKIYLNRIMFQTVNVERVYIRTREDD